MAHISHIHRLEIILLPFLKIQPIGQEVGKRASLEPFHSGNTVFKFFPIKPFGNGLCQSIHRPAVIPGF